jgi:hypothetical protein
MKRLVIAVLLVLALTGGLVGVALAGAGDSEVKGAALAIRTPGGVTVYTTLKLNVSTDDGGNYTLSSYRTDNPTGFGTRKGRIDCISVTGNTANMTGVILSGRKMNGDNLAGWHFKLTVVDGSPDQFKDQPSETAPTPCSGVGGGLFTVSYGNLSVTSEPDD